jgi:hypothetical protein
MTLRLKGDGDSQSDHDPPSMPTDEIRGHTLLARLALLKLHGRAFAVMSLLDVTAALGLVSSVSTTFLEP